MLKTPIALMVVFGGAVLLCGCGQKLQTEPQPLCLSSADDIETVMKRSEAVLVWMNFAIDKSDPEKGVIRTQPLPAGQLFEFWRKDNQGAYNRHLANTFTIHRTAELSFKRTGSGLCIDCNVTIERLSVPERQTDIVARQYEMFATSEDDMQTFVFDQEQWEKAQWMDIGRDNALESYILKKINERISKAREG